MNELFRKLCLSPRRRILQAAAALPVMVLALTPLFLFGQTSVSPTSSPLSTPSVVGLPATSSPVVTAPATNMAIGRLTQDSTPRLPSSADRSPRDRDDAIDTRTPAPLAPPPPSEFQLLVASTPGRTLPIFGDSLFNGVPSTFAPIDNITVGPGYILGPGDELNLQLTGQVNDQLAVTVDRTGAISVPGLGSVHVAGLPYGQLPGFLNAQLGKIYRNFHLDVNLGALRTIQVFVVGQARRPGSFSISSLSTLLNALFASGGPSPTGSVRDIQIKRGGKTVEHFDLYDLLLRGDKIHDVSLANGDVIFIPVVGPQVAVVGSVTNPAIFELKGETTPAQVLALAGGVTGVAATTGIHLERVFDHSMRSIEDVNLTGGESAGPLQNGDILSVGSVLDRFRNAVTLRGNVATPGRYVWHTGMRISDLVPNRESLITRNYWQRRNQLGQTTADYGPATNTQGSLQVRGGGAASSTLASRIPADLARDPNAGSTANLPSSSTSSSTGSPTSSVGGNSVAGALAGDNSLFGARTDVVLSAPDIDWSYAVIERQNAKDLTTSLIPFNLGKIVLDGDPSQNYELLPGDVITIFSKADLRVPGNQQTRFVRLEGEFNSSGVYYVLPGETLRGLLRRAGGLTSDAYLYASEFTRESTRRVETQRLREYADQLDAQISAETAANQSRALTAADGVAAVATATDARVAVARLRQLQPIGRIVLDLKPDSLGIDTVPDLALEDGDRFIVPRVPSNVTVEGQVYSANAFVFLPGERVLNYLKRAGGPDRQADVKRTFILRADGSVVSRQYDKVDRAPIFPGDTIVVPPLLDRRGILQRITNLATVVGQLGVGIATIAILARN